MMNKLSAQRAFEALRNGVPNADAVRELGCMQPIVLDRFREQLKRLSRSDAEAPRVVPGMLIAGGFGHGKSHTLSHFEQLVLDQNFVVSRIVTSKETPLYDTTKVFQAAVRTARLPDARGSLLHELQTRIDYHSQASQQFVDWAIRGQPHGMLAASVIIDERSHDDDLKSHIADWWSGEKLEVKRVRVGLKSLGAKDAIQVRAVRLDELAPVRIEFVARLARAAGLAGWVLLFDEVELISRYSPLQRGRAYAELSRWLGAVPGQGFAGTTAVAAISDDFDIVFQQRNDESLIPPRLEPKWGQEVAMKAKMGMELIQRERVTLTPPSDDTLARSFERLRDLYEMAYHVRPAGQLLLERESHRAMRSYVRRWICEWDLKRLYGRGTLDEDESLRFDLSEDPEAAGEMEESVGEST